MNKQKKFKPAQSLTFATVSEQNAQFICLLQSSANHDIHCDLGDVAHFDSAGLAFLIGAKRLCSKTKGRFVIENASRDILALAKLYGIEKILDNEEE